MVDPQMTSILNKPASLLSILLHWSSPTLSSLAISSNNQWAAAWLLQTMAETKIPMLEVNMSGDVSPDLVVCLNYCNSGIKFEILVNFIQLHLRTNSWQTKTKTLKTKSK